MLWRFESKYISSYYAEWFQLSGIELVLTMVYNAQYHCVYVFLSFVWDSKYLEEGKGTPEFRITELLDFVCRLGF